MISTFQLPMPPSINHYYGHCVTRDKKPRIYIMPKGLWYRQQVYFLTANKIKKLVTLSGMFLYMLTSNFFQGIPEEILITP